MILNQTACYLVSNKFKNRKFNQIMCGLIRKQSSISQRVHTEKPFRNFIKSIRNQIVFTIFRLIWNKKDVRLVPNQSEKGKYNLILA